MSNLPPGVTGNEWQIAGPKEWEMSVSCSSEGFTALTVTGYGKNQIAQAIEDVLQCQRTIATLPVHQRESVKDPYRVTPDTGFVRADEIDLALLTVAVSRLRNALGDITDVDIDMPCPFEGDVIVYQYDGLPTWECPLCRTEHEIEPE